MTLASETELREVAEAINLGGTDGDATLQALCDRYPADARVHFLLGAALERKGRYGDALIALDRVLALDPHNVQALSAKAMQLQALGRGRDAQSLLSAAVVRQPARGQLWANLGVLHEAAGDFEAALKAYDQAIEQLDSPISAHLNRGYVLTRLGRLEEALENNRALAASQPDYADAHFNVAEILLALHRYEQAHEACDRALAIDPGHVKAHIDRALARAALGKVEEAQQDLDRAKALSPQALAEFNVGFAKRSGGILEDFGAYPIYFHLAYEKLEQCDWNRREELVDSIRNLIARTARTPRAPTDPNLPFRTLGFDIEQASQHALVEGVAAAIESRALTQSPQRPALRVSPKARLRIGYVSPDFRIHPAAFLTRRLYRGHDRSRFEVLGYGLAPSDESWIAHEVRSGFDVFRDVSTLNPFAIARQIRDDDVDILVDLAGYTNFSRSEAFALRPAPLQVNWLGYPGTLGAHYMDYALVDRVVCPEGADEYWTEKLVRLPNSYFITDSDPRVDAATATRAKMGLPDEGFVFCCFNNAWKVEPKIFSVWMELLGEVPGSVFWLLALRPEVVGNLMREAAMRGIDPQRLIFGERLPNESHLRRYGLADLFLDTLYYNAHTTAIDALREGTPVVTAPGKTMPSRVAASVLAAADAPELICKDLEEYRKKALELARNPHELARIRLKLKQGRGHAPLFDTARFIRNLEAAFELMWNRCLQGLPPQAFDVREAPQRAIINRWF